MTTNEHVDAVSASAVDDAAAGPAQARRTLLTALLGAAGLGVAALSTSTARPPIGPDPTAPSPRTPNTQGNEGTDVAWVDTIGTAPDTVNVNLRGISISSTPPRLVVALGFHAPGDGGGGIFEWESGAGGTDDGGTIIVAGASAPTTPGGGTASTSSTGYWRRVYSGPLDVRWFGCKCDAFSGSPTDDTVAFANALAALAALASSPSGQSAQLVVSGAMLVGSASGWSPFLIANASNFSIVGLGDSCGFKLGSVPGLVGGTGLLDDGPISALHVYNCAGAQIRDLFFDASGLVTGLLNLVVTTNCLVADCTFRNQGEWPPNALQSIAGTGNVYRGNHFRACFQGAGIGLASWGYTLTAPVGPLAFIERNAVFTENVFTNCVGDTALWIAASQSTFSNNVFSGCSIAINVQGGATASFTGTTPPTPIPLGPSQLTISGNVITGGDNVGIRTDFVGQPDCRDWVIANNVIEGNGGSGIQILDGGSNITVTSNLIRNNNVSGILIGAGAGLTSLTISNNQIVDDRSPPVQGPGIYVLGSVNGVMISGNVINGVGGGGGAPAGILVAGSSSTPVTNVIVSSNVISNVQGATSESVTDIWGIYLLGPSQVVVSGNNVTNIGSTASGSAIGMGIRAVGASMSITGNYVRQCHGPGNDGFGMVVAGTGAYLSGNTIADNDWDLFAGMDAGEVVYSSGDSYTTVYYPDTYIVATDSGGPPGVGSSLPPQKRARDTAYPTSSSPAVAWNVGDIIYNTNAVASGFIGWVCVTAGTPGSWKTFGPISA